MKHTEHTKGQSLIEAIIAISVVVLLVTGLVSGTTASLKTSQRGRSRDQAVKLAEEGLEYARLLRDTNWSTFSGYTGSYCYDSSSATPLSPASSDECQTKKTTSDTVFTRILTFTLTATRMTVESKVTYTEGSQTQQVVLTTYLTQWK